MTFFLSAVEIEGNQPNYDVAGLQCVVGCIVGVRQSRQTQNMKIVHKSDYKRN